VRRVVVAGGRGFFGGMILERLRREGVEALAASRRAGADIVLDPEDGESARATLREGDVVIDAAGPFQRRTTALIRAATERGADVIDISDSLSFAKAVLSLRQAIDASGIRVLTSASAVSAVAAALVRVSGIQSPVRVTGFLAPATRFTARSGTARSLLHSVGGPIEVLRGGALGPAIGWSRSRRFELPAPLPPREGRLFESADSVLLPLIWPSLREVELYVDPNTRGLGPLLSAAARRAAVWRAVAALERLAAPLARLLGSSEGCLAYEVEAGDGRVACLALESGGGPPEAPVAPAVLAALAILRGRFAPRGLVLPDRQVDPEVLLSHLHALGVASYRSRS
jgi:Saccharopine dehydrogenase NADP binding domain